MHPMPTFIDQLLDDIEHHEDAKRRERRQQHTSALSAATSKLAIAQDELAQITKLCSSTTAGTQPLAAHRTAMEQRVYDAQAAVDRCRAKLDAVPDRPTDDWVARTRLADVLLRTWTKGAAEWPQFDDEQQDDPYRKRLEHAGYQATFSEDESLLIRRTAKTDLASHDAIVVDDFAACLTSSHMTITEHDDQGRPTVATLSINGHRVDVAIRNAHERYLPGWVPEALRWLPLPGTSTATDPWSQRPAWEPERIVFVAAERVILAPGPIVIRSRDKTFRNSRWEYDEVTFDGLVISCAERIQKELGAEPIVIDMHQQQPSPIQARIIQMIRDRTTDNSPWTKAPGSSQVTGVAPDLTHMWKQLCACLWSREFVGAAAKLKYLLEEGREQVRVWSLDYLGHSGFRMRTRDHSWLVGEVYVTAPAPSLDVQTLSELVTASVIRNPNNPNNQSRIITCGGWYISVWEE